jgi:integrase
MSVSDSSTPAPSNKPAKPYPDFPLFAHAAGVWAKKIRGKMCYFGPWNDPDGALAKYNEQKDALHAGRKPRPEAEGVTVKRVCNAFLNAKKGLVDTGELSPLSWREYLDTCEMLVNRIGKGRLVSDLGPDDFTPLREWMAEQWGLYRLGNTIQRIRSVFKYAYDAGLIDRPVRFGPAFRRPTQKSLRLHRAQQGPKLFTAEEVRRLLDAAGQPLKAMILLGINCGFGNNDVGLLPLSAVDLDAGLIDFPRPKTGVPRRCPLWPETVQALREVLAKRQRPKHEEHAGLVFITKYGLSWAKDIPDNPISKEMKKLLNALGINGRKGRGFYTLRHTFRTIADGAKDQPAADYMMGHEVAHMSSVYREGIDDERLKAVSDHVHRWLFPSAKPAPPSSGPAQPGDAVTF